MVFTIKKFVAATMVYILENLDIVNFNESWSEHFDKLPKIVNIVCKHCY